MQYCMAYTELRPNHRNIINGYYYGSALLSLPFGIAPYVMIFMRDKIALPSACCTAFPPLVSLMKTQRKRCFLRTTEPVPR